MGRLLDLTGNTYGHLVVLGKSKTQSLNKDTSYVCKCTKCKTIVEWPGRLLTAGKRKSCGSESCRVIRSTMTKEDRNKPPVSAQELKRIKEGIGRRSVKLLSEIDKAVVLWEYINGLPLVDISETYGIIYSTLDEFIRKKRDEFNSIHEINLLQNLEKMPLIRPIVEMSLRRRFTNEELLSRLSKDECQVLSDHEMAYAWIYFQTGNNKLALQESGLLDCLPSPTPHLEALLGMYLREKPNIVVYLKQLQAQQLGETFVDKSVIQQELVNQIKQLKENVQKTYTKS